MLVNKPGLELSVVDDDNVALLQLERLETVVTSEIELGMLVAANEVALAVPTVLARVPEPKLTAVVVKGVSVNAPWLLLPPHRPAVAVVLLVVVERIATSDVFATREPMYTVLVTVSVAVTVTVASWSVLSVILNTAGSRYNVLRACFGAVTVGLAPFVLVTKPAVWGLFQIGGRYE